MYNYSGLKKLSRFTRFILQWEVCHNVTRGGSRDLNLKSTRIEDFCEKVNFGFRTCKYTVDRG